MVTGYVFFFADPIFARKFLILDSKSVTLTPKKPADPDAAWSLMSDPRAVIPDPTLLIRDPTSSISDPTYLVTTLSETHVFFVNFKVPS